MAQLCKTKLFVFDIDDTLLPRGLFDIPKKSVNAINQLLKKGYCVCLASGRPFNGIKQYLDAFSDGCKYAIVANGAALFDYDGNLLYEKYMTPKDVYYLYNKYTKIPGVTVYGYDDKNGLMIFNHDKWIDHEIEVNKIDSIFDFSKKDYSNEKIKIYKTMIASEADVSKNIHLSKEELLRFRPTRSTVNYYEVLLDGASKESMIDYLVRTLNLDEKNVYTFGDNNNDIGMLKKYCGVALGNAIPDCKKVAKYVTTDVKDCGVAYALHDILKII